MNVETFKRTSDDWYPSYKIIGDSRVSSLVQVSFFKLSNNSFRCCIWGADDCGMDFDATDETLVWNIFLQVIGWDDVTRDKLKTLGFISA